MTRDTPSSAHSLSSSASSSTQHHHHPAGISPEAEDITHSIAAPENTPSSREMSSDDSSHHEEEEEHHSRGIHGSFSVPSSGNIHTHGNSPPLQQSQQQQNSAFRVIQIPNISSESHDTRAAIAPSLHTMSPTNDATSRDTSSNLIDETTSSQEVPFAANQNIPHHSTSPEDNVSDSSHATFNHTSNLPRSHSNGASSSSHHPAAIRGIPPIFTHESEGANADRNRVVSDGTLSPPLQSTSSSQRHSSPPSLKHTSPPPSIPSPTISSPSPAPSEDIQIITPPQSAISSNTLSVPGFAPSPSPDKQRGDNDSPNSLSTKKTSQASRHNSLKSRVSFKLPDIQTHALNSPSSLASRPESMYPKSATFRRPRGLPSLNRSFASTPSTAIPSSATATPSRTRAVATKPIGRRRVSRNPTPIVREIHDLEAVAKEVYFHTKTVRQVSKLLRTDPINGLTEEEAASRFKIFGPNSLKKEKGVSGIRLFFSHLIGVLNLILLAAATAAIIAAIVERSYAWIEGVFIMFIIFSNTVIGFTQEYRSAKTMQSLMNMFAPEADVTRNGERKTIQADQLVVGDVVHLEEGDFVPADLRITESVDFSIDESILTGESNPVSKITEPLEPEESQALGDRFNMAFMSSVVSSGRGTGIVVQTGESTQLGDIAQNLRSSDKDKKRTHLQQLLRTLGWVLLMLAVCLSIIALAIQILAVGSEALQDRHSWMYLVALCVAIIPEGLPAVLALTLAAGMRSMARKKAIVRKLGVLESVNWITDICTDKTGTLTEGKMMATMLWTEDKYYKVSGSGIIPEGQIYEKGGSVVPVESLFVDHALSLLLRICSLCSTATLTHVNDEWRATSSPTEIALQVLAYKANMGKPSLLDKYQFLGEHPFDSHVKRMSVIYMKKEIKAKDRTRRSSIERRSQQEKSQPQPPPRADIDFDSVDPSATYLFMKGSLESVLSKCTMYGNREDKAVPLDEESIKKIQRQADSMAARGLRVLAFAQKSNFHFDPDENRESMDSGSTFVGLVGIMDPPRPQSKPAVEKAHAAGINVYMLTGDHKKTAESIAHQVGILQKPSDYVMVGTQFEQREIAGDLPKVVARCNPNTKIRMIEQLRARDASICMTGDGVNDAPSIKKSDVGIAMGLNGSEVTKDVADIVLMDDNFGTIIVAIEEGRRIYSNIEKILLHVLSNNFALIIILVIGLVFSFFDPSSSIVYPLTPMQILWLNVITDTPLASSLGMEPVSKDAMTRRPRTKSEGIFTLSLNIDVLFYGIVVGTFSLVNFAITLFTGEYVIIEKYGQVFPVREYKARAVCLVTILYCMLFHVFNCVNPTDSVLAYHFSNIWVPITVVMGALLVIPCIYVPWVNVNVFLQYPLDWVEWIQVFVAVALFVTLSEFWKLFKKCATQTLVNAKFLIHLATRTTDAISDINHLMRIEQERARERDAESPSVFDSLTMA